MRRIAFQVILLIGPTFTGIVGCFSRTESPAELIAKPEAPGAATDLKAGQYVLRLFGTESAFVALFRPEDGSLAYIYKVLISSRGENFWKQIREDARVTRESRYFAASTTLLPSSFSKNGLDGGSFRADIYRGEPSKASSVGRSKMFKILAVVFSHGQETDQSATHVFLAEQGDLHAIPLKADRDIVSFSFVEGLTKAQLSQPWLNARLTIDQSQPATTRMGCSTNYRGEIVGNKLYEGSEIAGICEKQGRAGAQ